MIALGLVFILLAAGATVFAVIASATTSTTITLTALGVTLSVSPLALFSAGALAVILLSLGFALITRGTRSKARRRRELNELRRDHATAGSPAIDDSAEAGASTKTSADDGIHTGVHRGSETQPEPHPDAS